MSACSPAKLGAKGMEEGVEVKLSQKETAALQRSAAVVHELVELMHRSEVAKAS